MQRQVRLQAMARRRRDWSLDRESSTKARGYLQRRSQPVNWIRSGLGRGLDHGSGDDRRRDDGRRGRRCILVSRYRRILLRLLFDRCAGFRWDADGGNCRRGLHVQHRQGRRRFGALGEHGLWRCLPDRQAGELLVRRAQQGSRAQAENHGRNRQQDGGEQEAETGKHDCRFRRRGLAVRQLFANGNAVTRTRPARANSESGIWRIAQQATRLAEN